MTKKLNNDILSDFMRKMNLDKKDSSRFFDVFQEVFEEALMRDKVVKIGGLGTFKLVEVDARKSVDVNTGEQIEIAGHYKLNFVPEGAVRDLVNKPLAYLETVELDDTANVSDVESYTDNMVPAESLSSNSSEEGFDPLQKLTEQALELKDILNDINALGANSIAPASQLEDEAGVGVKEENEITKESVAESETNDEVNELEDVKVHVPEPVVTDEANQIVGGGLDDNQSGVDLKNKESDVDKVDEFNGADARVNADDSDSRKELLSAMNVIDEEELRRKKGLDLQSDKAIVDSINSENGKSRSNATIGWIVVAVILFATILALIFYQNIDFFAEKLSDDVILENEVVEAASVQVDAVVRADTLDNVKVVQVKSDTSAAAVLAVDTASWLYSPDFSDLFNSTRVYSEFIDTVVLNEGSRLTWISLQQYGQKDFWVYIYEANRDIIGDPNRIKVGTSVRIPRVDKKLIDASNPECVRYARYLHDLYVKKMK